LGTAEINRCTMCLALSVLLEEMSDLHGNNTSILQSINRSLVSFKESMRDIWSKIAIAVPSLRRSFSGDLINTTSAIANSDN
jgi:hypothetical protein